MLMQRSSNLKCQCKNQLMKNVIFVLFLILMLSSCSKKELDMPSRFLGKWTQTEIYGNDFWGGPSYWKSANTDIKVKFTSEARYYEKTFGSSSFMLIGTYKVLSDNKVEITLVDQTSLSHPKYTLNFNFEEDGQLTLGDFATEGVIKKKFKREK